MTKDLKAEIEWALNFLQQELTEHHDHDGNVEDLLRIRRIRERLAQLPIKGAR